MFSFFIETTTILKTIKIHKLLENQWGNEYIVGNVADIMISEQRIRERKVVCVFWI